MEGLARKDKERQNLEAAKNNLESYIYKIKNKLIDDEDNVKKVSTEEQREEISKLANDAEEWLYDDGYNADLATMEAKFAELATPAEKIFFRVAELNARPVAVEALKTRLDKIVNLMTKWETTHPQITEEERNEVITKVEEIKTWLAEKEAEQEKVSATEDPVFSSAELPAKTKGVEILVNRLSKKPKPKPPKKKKEENATKADNETTTEETVGDESTNSTGDEQAAAGEDGTQPTKEDEKVSGEAEATEADDDSKASTDEL